jgi:hypothetical protein
MMVRMSIGRDVCKKYSKQISQQKSCTDSSLVWMPEISNMRRGTERKQG